MVKTIAGRTMLKNALKYRKVSVNLILKNVRISTFNRKIATHLIKKKFATPNLNKFLKFTKSNQNIKLLYKKLSSRRSPSNKNSRNRVACIGVLTGSVLNLIIFSNTQKLIRWPMVNFSTL